MPEPKTRPTTASVAAYIRKLPDPALRDDCTALVKLMQSVARADAVMWGTAIVGFGTYTLTYADGRTADWPLIGFSPRKTSLVLYIPGLRNFASAVKKLGKTRTGGGCLYIKHLDDVDMKLLRQLLIDAVKAKRAKAGK